MKLSELSKRVILAVCILCAIVILASVIYYRSFEFLAFALGAFLTCGLNVVKIIMLERTVDKAIEMEAAHAKNYITAQYLFRLAITAVVLVAAALAPFINIWGAAAGILTYQPAVYSVKRFFCRDEAATKADKTAG